MVCGSESLRAASSYGIRQTGHVDLESFASQLLKHEVWMRCKHCPVLTCSSSNGARHIGQGLFFSFSGASKLRRSSTSIRGSCNSGGAADGCDWCGAAETYIGL